MGLCLGIVALAILFYLVLALGVNLVACFAPVPRKPVLNAALLAAVVICFLATVVRLIAL